MKWIKVWLAMIYINISEWIKVSLIMHFNLALQSFFFPLTQLSHNLTTKAAESNIDCSHEKCELLERPFQYWKCHSGNIKMQHIWNLIAAQRKVYVHRTIAQNAGWLLNLAKWGRYLTNSWRVLHFFKFINRYWYSLFI